MKKVYTVVTLVVLVAAFSSGYVAFDLSYGVPLFGFTTVVQLEGKEVRFPEDRTRLVFFEPFVISSASADSGGFLRVQLELTLENEAQAERLKRTVGLRADARLVIYKVLTG